MMITFVLVSLPNWRFAKASVHALWNCFLERKFESI